MRTLTIAAVMAGMALAGSANAATNLIINGSFEDGAIGVGPAGFTNWVYTAIEPGNALPQIIGLGAAADYPNGAFGEGIPADAPGNSDSPDAVGQKAAYFVGDAALETLEQSTVLGAGRYKMGFSAYVPFNGFNNRFNASFIGNVGGQNLATFNVDGTTPGVWKEYSAEVTLAQGTYTTKFTFDSDAFPAGDVVIDRAYLIAVPEPTTWGLMIVGFGAAGSMIRRRRAAIA